MTGDRNDNKLNKKIDEFMRIFRSAVAKARVENHRLGIPNVHWKDGIRYFELPDGEIKRTPPEG